MKTGSTPFATTWALVIKALVIYNAPMGIKDFFLRKALEHKLKDVPAEQRDQLMAAMEAHPEFFKKVGEEVQRRVKSGQSEMAATMVVMREHQAELQKILKK